MSPHSVEFLAGATSSDGAALARSDWVAQCMRRLRALRPDDDPSLLADVANQAWADVSAFDPRLAAEMEHLCWA